MGQSSSLSSTEHQQREGALTLLLLRALTLLLRVRFRSKWQKTPQNADVGSRDRCLLRIHKNPGIQQPEAGLSISVSWALLSLLLSLATILALNTMDQNGCFSSCHCVCISAFREKVGREEHVLFSIENSSMLCVLVLPTPRGPDHSHVTTHSFKESRKLSFFFSKQPYVQL